MVGALAGGAAAAVGGVALAGSSADKPPNPPEKRKEVPPPVIIDPPPNPPDPPVPPVIPPPSAEHGPKIDCRVNPDPPEGPSPLAVTFNMCGTTDPDGDPIRYSFDFGDGATSQGECRAKHTYSYPPGPASALATICARDGTRGHDACCQYTVKVRNACAKDERPPTVSVDVPVTDITTDDPVVVNARASDNVHVTAVEFIATQYYGPDIPLGIVRNPPYTVQWRKPPCGSYQVKAIAHDACGNAASSSESVGVYVHPQRCTCGGDTQPPSVRLASPPSTDPVTLHADATDDTGIARVEFFLNVGGKSTSIGDGKALGKGAYELPYSFECPLDTTFTATAHDVCGKSSESNVVEFVYSCSSDRPAGGGGGSVVQLSSDLRVVNGRGLVLLNGRAALSAAKGMTGGVPMPVVRGDNLVEALVAEGKGGGTWRFELSGEAVAGSLLVEAGDVVQVAGRAIVFRLAGKPGERVAFRFKATP